MNTVDIFPDKKYTSVSFDEITDHISKESALRNTMDVGQIEATWVIHADRPIAIQYFTDVHYGSIGTDYDLFTRHCDVLEKNPSMYCLMGGDTIDAFSGGKHPVAGIMGDAVPPEVQAMAMVKKLTQLDKEKKLGAIVWGNHEQWSELAGYSYENMNYRDIKAPIFTKGGVLHVLVGEVTYNIGLTHKHWGVSKLNISNSPKRALMNTYYGFNLDIMLTGDDHQSSCEQFYMNKKKYVVIDGGTYKLHDSFGQRIGLGEPGRPGWTIILWPDKRQIQVVDDPDAALVYV